MSDNDFYGSNVTVTESELASLRARLQTLETALRNILDADNLIDLESAIQEAQPVLRGREPETTPARKVEP